jgi:hypothetical protein
MNADEMRKKCGDLDYRQTLTGGTMPGAFLCAWIAAGLGLYGTVRYPSRPLMLAGAASLVLAAAASARMYELTFP